jgi:hypothetical protein
MQNKKTALKEKFKNNPAKDSAKENLLTTTGFGLLNSPETLPLSKGAFYRECHLQPAFLIL